MNNGWVLHAGAKEWEHRQATEPVYTLGNGYLCARGFFEEEPEGLLSYGGTYIAGVFGQARYMPWRGLGRELVNTSNLFAARIFVDGEPVFVNEQAVELETEFEMKAPLLRRSYLWQSQKGSRVSMAFERFISGSCLHTAGQKITITTLKGTPLIRVGLCVNTNVLNLNMVSSEPLPQQPGVRHLKQTYSDFSSVVSEISGYQRIVIAQGQAVACTKQDLVCSQGECENVFEWEGQSEYPVTLSKLVYTYTNLDELGDPLQRVKEQLARNEIYEEALVAHTTAWAKKWECCDITIEGNAADQAAIRYNMLQLMQALPPNSSNSIGARGLTGEMYEGCIFWDTEIFMLPFFTYTQPEAARRLLKFRYKTLPEAQLHAKNNHFEGAMYGWQVSEQGIEQTPQGVGAFYSIHVVADIAYAIGEYWNATHDESFMLNGGAEILVETARFWTSRVHQNPKTGLYDLLAVRGPNEYDVIVNNNLYTNMMAQQNLLLVADMVALLHSDYPVQWAQLAQKLAFQQAELAVWAGIREKIVLPYDATRDLYEEDDMYFCRVPLNLGEMKTSLKRVIDTTLPYEALMLYQITKQADVLHVMKNLHWRFTPLQKRNAWDYYVPKTCFDSSLGYCMHAVMAAQMGLGEDAYYYYEVCSNFDMCNMQLNTISGLHFANFGGTWQAVVFGFAGVQVGVSGISITPCLPKAWESLSLPLCYQGSRLKIHITHTQISVRLEVANDTLIDINFNEKVIQLNKTNREICLVY